MPHRDEVVSGESFALIRAFCAFRWPETRSRAQAVQNFFHCCQFAAQAIIPPSETPARRARYAHRRGQQSN